ncbi:MAG: hypothetical protein AB7F86_08770 [Bdellovibrionales bacterium]
MKKILGLLGLLLPYTAWAGSVTYIGDSQSASRGGLFAELRQGLGSLVQFKTARSVCGATIDGYLTKSMRGSCRYKGVTSLDMSEGRLNFPGGSGQTALIDELMRGSDTVIVQLGDNHLAAPESAGVKARALATKIKASGKKCVWIGPASVSRGSCSQNHARKKAVSESIKAAIAGVCQFVDSFAATQANPPRSGDCLHYANYSQWSSAILSQVAQALSVGGTKTKSTASAGANLGGFYLLPPANR